MKNLNKIAIVLLATLAMGVAAPANARGWWMPEVSQISWFPDFMSLRSSFNQALKNANNAYRTASQSARVKYFSALNLASNRQEKLSALKTYLTDLLATLKQRNSASEAALQALINGVSALPATQPPVAHSQSAVLTKNTSKAITLSGFDPQNLNLTYTVVTNPGHGSLSGTAPNLTYTPATNYTGLDSFTFKANNGTSDSNIATVYIIVIP